MKIFMEYCPECERENWSCTVARGICAWCGYIAKKSDIKRNTGRCYVVTKKKEKKCSTR